MTNDITDSKLSRRQFIGTTAAGAAAVGAGAILTPKLGETLASSTKPTTLAEMVQAHPSVALPKLAQPIPVPPSWNGVADVIVVGLGGAGAAAALNAAAAGAQVLV